MKNTSETYKQIIRSGNTRNWEIIVIVTFTDGQVYSFTEHTIIQGSFKVETAVSSDSKFDIGSAIISKCSFSLNNWDDWYTDLDFYNATAMVEVKLKGDTQYHRIGMFTVDEPTFAGSVVQLELLDNMWKFDKPFSEGYLSLRWYNIISHNDLDGGTFNTYTTPYSDGDVADGGDFLDYTSGDSYDGGSFAPDPNVAYFTRLMSRNIGTDDITITGVKFVLNETEYKIGQDGYVLSLQNPLVNESNVSAVLNLIWDVLENFKIRPFDITALPDIAPEVGDCVAVSYKGDLVYSYLSSYTFTSSMCTAKLGAESPSRNLTTRYSADSLNTIAIAKKEAEKVVSDFDKTVQQMNDLAINAIGAYQDYEDVNTGGRIYYLSNQPITKSASGHCTFVDGSTVFKATGDGFFVSTQVVSGEPTNWQNGYNTQTGELVVNVLNAIGVNADWIKAGHISADLINSGTFVVGGSGFNSPNLLIKDSHNTEIGSWNTDGITAEKGSFGKLYIDGQRLIIPKDTNVIYEENYSHYTTKIIVKTTFIPFYKGWTQDTQMAVLFSADKTEGASEITTACTLEVFKIATRSKHSVGKFLMRCDGSLRPGSTGATSDPIPTFAELIDHTWGANQGEYYSIEYTIFRRSYMTGDAASMKIYDADNLAQIGAVLTEENIIGSFIGNYQGQGNFNALNVGDWSFDFQNQQMIIQGDETDPTDYDGTKIGRDEIKLIKGDDSLWMSKYHLGLYGDGSAIEVRNQSNVDLCYLQMNGTRPRIEVSNGTDEITIFGGLPIFQINASDYLCTLRKNSLSMSEKNSSMHSLKQFDHNEHNGLFQQSYQDYYERNSLLTEASLRIYHSDVETVQLQENFFYHTMFITESNITKRIETTNPVVDVTYPVMWDTGSDERLKENITDLDLELSKKLIDGSQPKEFKYKHEQGRHYGFIAQDVRKQLDDLGEDDVLLERPMEVDDLRTINYHEYIPHLVNYVKELRAELDSVKAELKALKES